MSIVAVRAVPIYGVSTRYAHVYLIAGTGNVEMMVVAGAVVAVMSILDHTVPRSRNVHVPLNVKVNPAEMMVAGAPVVSA